MSRKRREYECNCDGCVCGEPCVWGKSNPTGNTDRDDRNPVDLTAQEWREIMSDPDYPDDDQEP